MGLFTDIEKYCAIVSFVYDVILKDFIIQRLRLLLCGRHNWTFQLSCAQYVLLFPEQRTDTGMI